MIFFPSVLYLLVARLIHGQPGMAEVRRGPGAGGEAPLVLSAKMQ